MNNDLVTVIIRTIGRPTLVNAIESAKKEFGRVIVVADAIDLDINELPKEVTYLKTGKKFDMYGSAAINLGAYSCSTPYFCLLDDDDEFMLGAGEYMLERIVSHPDVDIWIPGLYYNNGGMLCMNSSRGVSIGNVAVPTYKTDLLFKLPFSSTTTKENPNCVDFYHVESLFKSGCKIAWYGAALYNIRPRLEGSNGRGRL